LRIFGLISFNNSAYYIAKLAIKELVDVHIWVLEILVGLKFKVSRAAGES
jgi:hypothetical protein